MADDVIFTGYKDGVELSEIYASADIFIFPSLTETFGNVVLEAIASGLPVISLDKGGVTENVISGYNGFQASSSQKDDFIKKTGELISDHNLRTFLAQNSVKFAHTKNWDEIFNKLLNDYSIVIDKKSRKQSA